MSQSDQSARRNYQYAKLDNGLEILGEVNPGSRSSALGFFVKTGARDESSEVAGVSHFLEHMMFKGTPSRSALDITYQLGALGAQANAFTSEENTVYYAGVLPENFRDTLELFSDMLRPALRSEDFDTEKKVILEEIALYQDRPTFSLYERALRDYYAAHPCGNSVLGSIQSITDLSRDQMQTYFDRRYQASNVSLVASGNFSFDDFVADATKLCGKWTFGETTRVTQQYGGQSVYKEYRKKDLQQGHLLLLCEGPSAQEDARYPMAILSVILGDGSGSKLYWSLVHKGIAESAGCDSDERDGTGLFVASASAEIPQLEQCSKVIHQALDSALDFSDEDLALAKTKLVSRIVMNGELSMGRLMAIGLEWNYRREVTPLRELVARIRAIERSDIERAFERFQLKVRGEFRLIPE